MTLRSLKVIENDTIKSSTHDFLLTFHSNHRPISHRFRDKRRFTSKIARKLPIFPSPCIFNAPAEAVPLGIGYRRRGQKKLDRQTPSQPPSHVAVAYTALTTSRGQKSGNSLTGYFLACQVYIEWATLKDANALFRLIQKNTLDSFDDFWHVK